MIVVVESPFAGDVDLHVAYLRACLRHSLLRGESPFASHGLYTQPGVLDDTDPADRKMGIGAGLEFYSVAKVCAVYTDLGVSRGMKEGILRAKSMGVEVDLRSIAPVTIAATYRGEPAQIVIRKPGGVLIRPRGAPNRCFIRRFPPQPTEDT